MWMKSRFYFELFHSNLSNFWLIYSFCDIGAQSRNTQKAIHNEFRRNPSSLKPEWVILLSAVWKIYFLRRHSGNLDYHGQKLAEDESSFRRLHQLWNYAVSATANEKMMSGCSKRRKQKCVSRLSYLRMLPIKKILTSDCWRLKNSISSSD